MARKKKRHTDAEIISKMEEARALVAQGRNQSDIAQALGISVMTFHRWRKAMAQQQLPRLASISATATRAPGADAPKPRGQGRIAEIQLENERLRRLVTDLLLEKMRLEDETKQVGRRANG
jgi:transposase